MNVTYTFLPRNANKRPGDRDGKKDVLRDWKKGVPKDWKKDVPRDWRKVEQKESPKHVGPLQLL